jgi:uncharacterized DUF497 family protein
MRVKRGGWEFEWDPEKARANFHKHRVTFTEAATVFADPYALDLVDRIHPGREVLIGHSERERLLYTVYVEVHGKVIRIISARRATPQERREYERQQK